MAKTQIILGCFVCTPYCNECGWFDQPLLSLGYFPPITSTVCPLCLADTKITTGRYKIKQTNTFFSTTQEYIGFVPKEPSNAVTNQCDSSEAKNDNSELTALLNANALQDIANKICSHTPKGYVISLCIEDGAAWVELSKDSKGDISLPDSSDKNLLEQINDALCVANGWSI